MSESPRKILVTSALPYANGPIHLGHLLEYIQTDIWVRFQKMQGNTCYYVCADDAHGTAIMLRAEQEGITPEALIERINQEHQADFSGFGIAFDHYGSTHCVENQTLAEQIYAALESNGHIAVRQITQAYDPEKNLFLADRFIKGTCPKCGAEDQYGDNCEACGATYAAADLIDSRSVLSGVKPVEKASDHYFFRLPEFEAFLREWTTSGALQPQVANKLAEWLDAGLQEWDISRDAPYFGFRIPGTEDKYFYVWLDAPIGYMASFRRLCDTNGLDFDAFWQAGSDAELYHFIGKDIINFHALFWPAMLSSASYRTPTGVFAHGFVTVNGQKMSKSRGTFIKASTYLEHLNPEYLRYYFAAKLTSGVDDLDLNLEDFIQRVNTDLVGKLINIASRCASFIHRLGDGRLSEKCSEPALYEEFVQAGEAIAAHFDGREFGKAIRDIMALADRANRYIDHHKPWALSKDPANRGTVVDICSTGLNLFRVLVTYLAPVVPEMAARSEAFLATELTWDDRATPLTNRQINRFQPLMTRVDPKRVKAMVEASREVAPTPHSGRLVHHNEPSPEAGPLAPTIDFATFAKTDLRVARVLKAENVPGSKKLLKLILDVGEEQRQVFAGISEAYSPDQVIGKLVVLVANLAPRKMRFGVSEGMVLCAGAGGKETWLLEPHPDARPGTEIN